MKASDVDEDRPPYRQVPGAREWLRVMGAAIAILLICIVWTFWA